jgi:hypothetical protein
VIAEVEVLTFTTHCVFARRQVVHHLCIHLIH